MTRFALYTSTALLACVRCVAVIPLGTAAAWLGTLELYRYWPQAVADGELDAALAFAAMITGVLSTRPIPRDGTACPLSVPVRANVDDHRPTAATARLSQEDGSPMS